MSPKRRVPDLAIRPGGDAKAACEEWLMAAAAGIGGGFAYVLPPDAYFPALCGWDQQALADGLRECRKRIKEPQPIIRRGWIHAGILKEPDPMPAGALAQSSAAASAAAAF